MSCCSNRRQAPIPAPRLRAAFTPMRTPPPSGAGPALVYTGQTAVALRGPFSGRIYNVSREKRFVEADAKDVEALLRCGLFERPD